MRQDAGISGDAQRIEQMVWLFFLKVYDAQEETWEYKSRREKKVFKSIIPEELRWRNWAVDNCRWGSTYWGRFVGICKCKAFSYP